MISKRPRARTGAGLRHGGGTPRAVATAARAPRAGRPAATLLPLLLLLASSVTVAQARTWTLERVLDVARAGDPRVLAARARGEAGRAEASAALGGLSPRLSVTAGAMRGDDPAMVFTQKLRQGRFTAQDFSLPSLNDPDPRTGLEWGFLLDVPLFNGASELTSPALRGHLRRAADGYERAGVAGALLMAAETYVAAVRARAALAADSMALAAATEATRAAVERFRMGQVPELDTLRAAAGAAQTRAGWLQAGSDLDAALARLARLVGEPVTAADLESPAAPPVPARDSVSASHRGELVAAREQARALGTQASRAGWALLPSLNGRASLSQYRGAFDDPWARHWTAGLALDLPLWDGAQRWKGWKAAAARARAAEADAVALERDLAAEARSAAAGLRVAAERADAMRQARRAAEEAQRLALDRYRAGLLPFGELLAAEAEAARARQGSVDAEAGVTLSHYHYLHATGELR